MKKMGSETKHVLVVFVILLVSTCCFLSYELYKITPANDKNSQVEKDDNPYATYYMQNAELIDCQQICTDESFIPGLDKETNTFCFWNVRIGDENFIMWKVIGSDKFGFLN